MRETNSDMRVSAQLLNEYISEAHTAELLGHPNFTNAQLRSAEGHLKALADAMGYTIAKKETGE